MRLQLAAFLAAGLAMPLSAQTPDWKAVESAMGRSGTAQAGDVYRFNFPRSDLRVTVGALRLKPALALGGWVAMHPVSGGIHGPTVMAMGDLVLTERELAPVMDRLLKGGIEITAIHHHVIRETPRILYMHIHAVSDPVDIAKQVHDALALTKTPPAAPAAASTS